MEIKKYAEDANKNESIQNYQQYTPRHCGLTFFKFLGNRMISFNLASIANQIHAQHLGADASFSSVSTDSRTLKPGDLFIALKGPQFDGHDFIQKAAKQGAVGAMVSKDTGTDLPCLLVKETNIGLGALAASWRQASGVPLVAVTGSNGKTTVKEMLAAIMRQREEKVLATQGNLNNEIGLPLTLLRLQDHTSAVVELGANHPGEIKYLSNIARPDVALLNNAGRAHLEGFGSMEAVARAKAEIISGLADDGVFVLNADDPWAPLWYELAAGCRITSFGIHKTADVSSPLRVFESRWDENSFHTSFPIKTAEWELEIELPLAGEHNCMNALAATAAAVSLGFDKQEIRQGLQQIKPVKGRLSLLKGREGVTIIDDSYNANPDSIGAAISVLAAADGRKLLVLGELAELGTDKERVYPLLGEQAKHAGIDLLLTLGEAGKALKAFGNGSHNFSSHQKLIEQLQLQLRPGDKVLIKGSRVATMEQVVAALTIEESF